MSSMSPLIIMVAPNGARRNQLDHHGLPITIAQTVLAAAACQGAGASVLHGHIRDEQGRHSLDIGLYKELIAEMAIGVPDMLVQITTEAVGQYTTQEQMQLVTKLQPKMASVALRELVPNSASEAQAKHFFHWALEAQVHLQIIVYDSADVDHLTKLRLSGVLPKEINCVLYVLGRYRQNLCAEATDLDDFLRPKNEDTWFTCAFGQQEHACMTRAIDQGGHARVGFENNLWLSSGELAPSNDTLVAQVATYARSQGQHVANAKEAQLILGVRD